MKRTLVIAFGGPTVAALFLLAGGSPAYAGEQHHRQDSRSAVSLPHTAERGKHHHDCTTGKRCRPKPLPKPANGWPCAKTHSCATHHHYPICKPPIVATPRPPVVKPPTSHVGGHKPPVVTVASPAPEQLPRTGSNVLAMVLTAGGLIGAGTGLTRVRKASA